MTATIRRLPPAQFPWVWAVTFDYSPEMVSALKAHIPSRNRKWDPETRQWLFKGGEAEAIAALCTAYCGGYVHVEDSIKTMSLGANTHGH